MAKKKAKKKKKKKKSVPIKLPPRWRQNLVIREESKEDEEDEFRFVLRFKKGKEIKGIPLKAGYLYIEKGYGRYFVGSSHLTPKLRNKKIGKKLYLHALNTFGQLTTEFNGISDKAMCVWLSLVKTHRYVKDRHGLTVFKD